MCVQDTPQSTQHYYIKQLHEYLINYIETDNTDSFNTARRKFKMTGLTTKEIDVLEEKLEDCNRSSHENSEDNYQETVCFLWDNCIDER